MNEGQSIQWDLTVRFGIHWRRYWTSRRVQLGVDSRHHPRADMAALLVGYRAPRLVARLAGGGDEPPPPQLLARRGVVGGDDAALGPAPGVAAPARVHLPAGDDRPRGLVGGVHRVVEDLGVPHHVAGLGVEGDDVVVHGGVDDQLAVDGDVAVGLDEGADHVVAEVVGPVAAVLPDEVAGHRVDGLDDVLRVIDGDYCCRSPSRRPAGGEALARRVTLPVFLVEAGLVMDAQLRRLREKRMAGKTLAAAAPATGMSERTARKWQSGRLPSAAKAPRTWRTREDPFADVW